MELPGKIYIDVSWYPEHDPSGGYVVRVLQSRKVLGETESKSPHETIAIVEELCRRLCQPAAVLGGNVRAVSTPPTPEVSPCGQSSGLGPYFCSTGGTENPGTAAA